MRQPGTLTPAVAALVADGSLHEFDAEWIGRLRPGAQLAAALKCVRNFGIRMNREDNPKSCVNPGKSRAAVTW